MFRRDAIPWARDLPSRSFLKYFSSGTGCRCALLLLLLLLLCSPAPPHPAPHPFFSSSLPSLPPSLSTSIHFHFLNVAICSVTRPRLGREAVGRFHRTWSCSRWREVTGQRWWGCDGGGGRGTEGCLRDRVISYLGETSWSAGRSAGPQGVPAMHRRRSP